MAVVSQGNLAEWSAPRLFATLTGRRFTGEMVIASGGRDYRVAWEAGGIVGARSPHPADSAAKVAIGLGVLNSTQAGDIVRLLAAAPGHDEMEVVAQVARLSSDLIGRLARRIVGVRASRALSVEVGTFTVLDELPYWGNVAPVDARWVLYNGIRSHLTVDRVGRDLAALASSLRLRDGADVNGFGFGAPETLVLERLSIGALPVAPLPPELDQQVAGAVALTLLLTGEVVVVGPPVAVAAKPAVVPVAKPVVAPAPAVKPVVAPAPVAKPVVALAPVAKPAVAPVAKPVVAAEKPEPIAVKDAQRAPRRGAANADQIRALVAERIAAVDRGADHFALLDVSQDAPPEEVRTRYFALARHLHPDRLEAAGVDDVKKDAQRLFARMNEAFTTLTDPEKRYHYTQMVRAGGEVAVKAREAATEAAVRRALDAEERFRIGEMALRRQQFEVAVREFQKAIELDPEESDHHAMLGWAVYVAATNKSAAVPGARGHLLTAADKNKRSALPYLYLGRIARMEGNHAEAEKHLNRVLEISPGHSEATAELRALDTRRAPKPTDKGLFSKLTKKP